MSYLLQNVHLLRKGWVGLCDDRFLKIELINPNKKVSSINNRLSAIIISSLQSAYHSWLDDKDIILACDFISTAFCVYSSCK